MRLGPLVLLALIALVAPSQTHAQVPAPSVQIVDGPAFLTRSSARPTARPDDVVARLMSFDRNNDGRIEKAELAERMYTVMERGDANGDGCLDRTELLTLASAKPAQAAVRGFEHGSYVVGPNNEVSSRPHLEGALDDLRLDAARKEQALGVISTFSKTLDADAQAELLGAMQTILGPEQLVSFTTALEQERGRSTQGFVKVAIGQQGVSAERLVFMLAALELRVPTFKLAPEANTRATAAIKQYRSRLRPNEAERVELGRQLTAVLTEEEAEDFVAAIARQPVVAAGGVFTKRVMGSVGAAPTVVVKR